MISIRVRNAALGGLVAVMLAACGTSEGLDPMTGKVRGGRESHGNGQNGSLLDLFRGGDTDVKVNRFLWTASLEVLNFLPVTAADPFTGVISTGYGTPPGGGRAYRATILISDPALDARSLNVSLQTRNGPVAAGTQRAVEDAILNRARQLRVNAERF